MSGERSHDEEWTDFERLYPAVVTVVGSLVMFAIGLLRQFGVI